MTAIEHLPFTLRPAVLEDLEDLVDVFNLAAEEAGSEVGFTVEGYTAEWKVGGWELAENTRVAVLPDGKRVGLIERWSFAPYLSTWLWARVHPDYQNQGIGTAFIEWAEQCARDNLHLAPPDARVVMLAGGPSNHAPTRSLLTDRGFQVIRNSFIMARDLDDDIPEPLLPDGISIRAMRPGEEADVYRAYSEAFLDHWGHVEVPFEEGFARDQARFANDPNYDPSLWFLAMDGDEIAGVSLCWPKIEEFPDGGWVGTLGVRRPWRRHGLGLALLYHSFHELRRRGKTSVGLSVDGSSLTGATRLYERAGMRVFRQFDTYEKVLRDGVEYRTQQVHE